ncbi:hypothetical protein HGRIS_012584 [Hohenbuehelia grisea]|uniref:Uncharacterized protein n=1 Tax=Hohenbuehelia grisea TaxID=104357 RepID=A0ABR3ISQ3_9AGAR
MINAPPSTVATPALFLKTPFFLSSAAWLELGNGLASDVVPLAGAALTGAAAAGAELPGVELEPPGVELPGVELPVEFPGATVPGADVDPPGPPGAAAPGAPGAPGEAFPAVGLGMIVTLLTFIPAALH